MLLSGRLAWGPEKRVVGKGRGEIQLEMSETNLRNQRIWMIWMIWLFVGKGFSDGQFFMIFFFSRRKFQMPGFLGCSYKKPLRCGATVEHCQTLRI